MTRLESSAWPLAGGSASVFALAVVLDRLPWLVAFGAVALAVAVWAWQCPPVAGAGVGVVAWLCVTGFDVHHFGDIEITGGGDAMRAAVLVLAGVSVAVARVLAEAYGRRRRADPLWAEFYATTPGSAQEGVPVPPRRRGGESGLEEAAPRTSDRGAE
jgi:hypothetical protein